VICPGTSSKPQSPHSFRGGRFLQGRPSPERDHLFLRCADRRFWSWQPGFEALGNLPERRAREVFYQFNRNTVENRMRANDQALEKTFLGTKVLEGEMAPWIL